MKETDMPTNVWDVIPAAKRPDLTGAWRARFRVEPHCEYDFCPGKAPEATAPIDYWVVSEGVDSYGFCEPCLNRWWTSNHPLIEDEHLDRLKVMAVDDLERLYLKRPEFRAAYLGSVLAQGGALHYLDGVVGAADLDVWHFFSDLPRFPMRRTTHPDFGLGLGRSPGDRWASYVGLHVDFMCRTLPVSPGSDLSGSVREWMDRYVMKPRTSGWYLAQKAVVSLDGELIYRRMVKEA